MENKNLVMVSKAADDDADFFINLCNSRNQQKRREEQRREEREMAEDDAAMIGFLHFVMGAVTALVLVHIFF